MGVKFQIVDNFTCVVCVYQGIIDYAEMETRQIFSRMFVIAIVLDVCLL